MIYHYSVVNNENPEDVIHTSIGRIDYPTWASARAMGNAMLVNGGWCHPDTHHFIISEHEEVEELGVGSFSSQRRVSTL